MAGANVVGVRVSNRELAPFWGAGLRFALADLLLFALVVLWRLALPRGRALLGAILYGLLNFGAFFAFAYWGLLRVPGGVGSVLLASTPLLTLLFARLHRVEPFRWRSLFGASLALVGLAAMFIAPGTEAPPLLSILALLMSAACAAEASVLLKLFPSSHPVTTNAVGMGAGTLLLLPLSLVIGEAWTLPTRPDVWIALAYLVPLGSFALFILYVFALRRWTATGMSYLFVLMPLVAVSLSAWLDGESLTPGLLVGGALVLAGVYVGALAGPSADRRGGAKAS